MNRTAVSGCLPVQVGFDVKVTEFLDKKRPTPLEPKATSLKRLLHRSIMRKKLLVAFLDRFEQDLGFAMSEAVIDRWKTYNATLGNSVTVVTHNETIDGRAVDVDVDGALLVEQTDGAIKKMIYGDCFH